MTRTMPGMLHLGRIALWGCVATGVMCGAIAVAGPGPLAIAETVRWSGWAALLPGVALLVAALVLDPRPTSDHAPVVPNARTSLPLLAGVATILLALSLLTGTAHNFLGDGGLAYKYAGGAYPYKGLFAEPGCVGLVVWVSGLLDENVHAVFRTLSTAGAVLYLVAAAVFAARLTISKASQLAVLLFVALQPLSLIFAAYPETYAIPAGAFALFLVLITLPQRPAVVAGLVAVALVLALLHPLFLIFTPALVCHLLGSRMGSRRCLLTLLFGTALGIAIHAAVSVLHAGPGLSPLLLPMSAHDGQVYTILSWRHATDLAQLALLVLGPSLVAFTFATPHTPTRIIAGSPLLPFALTSLCALFLLDFKLGFLDWDVFALICLPIVWLVAHAIALTAPATPRHAGVRLALAVSGVCLLWLIPWFALNASSPRAARLVASLATHDSHQQLPNRRLSLAQRFLEAGQDSLYTEFTGQTDGTIDTTSPLTRNNYAVMLMRQGRESEALVILRDILRREPLFAQAHVNAAQIFERKLGLPDSAIAHYAAAWAVDTSALTVLMSLARSQAVAGDLVRAEQTLTAYTRRAPADCGALMQLARIRLSLGGTQSAGEALAAAASSARTPLERQQICGMARSLPGGTDDCDATLARLRVAGSGAR